MEKIKIEGRKYHELACSGKVFNNYTFAGCTFESVAFSQCTFVNCTFINCNYNGGCINNSRFISCSFFSCSFFDFDVIGNELLNCQCDGLEFTNNTIVTNNIFDRLTGNINLCDCVEASDNTFKNMDFSGFANFYYQSFSGMPSSLSRIDWVKNKFINTTISVDAIMKLAKKAKAFGFPYATRKGYVCNDGISVVPDMRELTDEARFVLTANAFLRLPKIEETNRDSKLVEEGILSCDLHLSAVDNDDAIIIVDKDGRILKPCAIPRIDEETHFFEIMKNATILLGLVQIDGSKYEIDFNDSSIYEPSKHPVKK